MNALKNFWWRLVEWSGFRRTGFTTEIVDDLPDVLAPARLYLIGDLPLPWSAAMLCPCGCKAAIQLSLLANDTPSWQMRRNFWGFVTLYPSVRRTRGCRSHFHLRHGRVVWSLPPDSRPFQNFKQGAFLMSGLSYPQWIDQRADGALSTMRDYLSHHIEALDDVAMMETRAVGMAAKLVYFNTIRSQLKAIASGERNPSDGLRHLDAVAQKWRSGDADARDSSERGSFMARELYDCWYDWATGGSACKERAGFVDYFGLPR